MIVLDTEILDLKIIEPTVYEDERGYFFEAYNAQKFEELMGFCPSFCQSNESASVKGTIRGLHLQKEPYAQSKLVRVVSGEVLDVAVDCRSSSSSFGKHVAVKLSSGNRRQLWIPKGFAHGFQALSDVCILNYQVDNFYSVESEVTIDAFDDFLGINWLTEEQTLLGLKDRNGENFLETFNKVLPPI